MRPAPAPSFARRAAAALVPKSNVLTFELASGSRVIARPSGTEPKAKFYVDVREEVGKRESVAKPRERARAVPHARAEQAALSRQLRG